MCSEIVKFSNLFTVLNKLKRISGWQVYSHFFSGRVQALESIVLEFEVIETSHRSFAARKALRPMSSIFLSFSLIWSHTFSIKRLSCFSSGIALAAKCFSNYLDSDRREIFLRCLHLEALFDPRSALCTARKNEFRTRRNRLKTQFCPTC